MQPRTLTQPVFLSIAPVSLSNTFIELTTMQNNALAVKLPDFWPEDVNIWFTQCDAQFCISKVTTKQTKFDYVIQKLDYDTVKRVRD